MGRTTSLTNSIIRALQSSLMLRNMVSRHFDSEETALTLTHVDIHLPPPHLHIPQCPDLSICPSCLLYTCLCLSMCSMWLYAYFVCAFLSDLGCPENSFTTELSMEQGKHVWGTHAFLVPWFLHTLLECASSWLTSWWQ